MGEMTLLGRLISAGIIRRTVRGENENSPAEEIQALAHLKAVDEGHMKGIGPVDDAVDEEGSHGEPPEPGW